MSDQTTDILSADRINSLAQPLRARLAGGRWWPVHDIEPRVGLLRIDVCGVLEARYFADVMEIEDMDGGRHDPDVFYADAAS